MSREYYSLTLEDLKIQYEKGFMTATGLLFNYLKIKFAPGEQIEIEPEEVIAELGISKSQFYKALSRIKKSEGMVMTKSRGIVIESIKEEK